MTRFGIGLPQDERRARQRRDAYLDGLYGPGRPPREVAVDDAEQVEGLAALVGLVAR